MRSVVASPHRLRSVSNLQAALTEEQKGLMMNPEGIRKELPNAGDGLSLQGYLPGRAKS